MSVAAIVGLLAVDHSMLAKTNVGQAKVHLFYY